MGLESSLFILLALVSVFSAAGMILVKNAVHSALFLILNFACVALLFLMLDAAFISMVQIAVYAGAIMVLFLFVIMLLGAEQAAETDTRPLKWVSSAGGILPFILFAVLAVTLVFYLGGLDLPKPAGDDPHLRIVHAANVADPITITVSDETIGELSFSGATDFMELDAGEHDVTITDADGVTVFSDSVALELDTAFTLLVHGDGIVETTIIANSFETTGDKEAHLVFLNLFTQEPIQLVNIGRERVLNTNDQGAISDQVILDSIPYGEVIEYEATEGDYNWSFYNQLPNGDWNQVISLIVPNTVYWTVEGNTEQLIILVPDYAGQGSVPRILDNAQEELLIQRNEPFGAPGDIGRELFVTYLLPINLVGFLLLVALIGVIVLTRPQGVTAPRRSTINRRRKVSRPLTSVISQQTGRDVVEDTPMLDEPSSGD